MPTVIRYANGTAVIYPERLFSTTGEVGRWTNQVAGEMELYAKAEAPERSGDLKAGISARDFRQGPTSRGMVLNSTAPHTEYVVGGTQGPIVSNRGPVTFTGFTPFGGGANFLTTQPARMAVGRDSAWGPTTYMTSVSGQRANDFIGRAMATVGSHHSALSGFTVIQAGVEF